MIINLQKSYMWKLQLTIVINFIFSKDFDEERGMYSKSDNKEFMTYDNANGVVDELFESPLLRYKIGLETYEKEQFYFQFSLTFISQMSQKHCRSYIEFPDWIRNKKAIINPINKDDKCFQYAGKIVLDHEKLGKEILIE